MTEIEKLQRAKMYISKLAEGVDPITDKELPEDTALNNVRLSRCFFYVAQVLQGVLDNGGEGSKAKKRDFVFGEEEKAKVKPGDSAVSVSEFVKAVNSTVLQEGMKELSYAMITPWLVENGILEEKVFEGKSKKFPTPKGQSMGLYTENRQGMRGPYTVILYNKAAQQFLLDHLPEMVSAWYAGKANTKGSWSDGETAELLTEFANGLAAEEMARAHGRTQEAIRAKLMKLGKIRYGNELQ